MEKYTIRFKTVEQWSSINIVEVKAESEEDAERIFLENYGDYLSRSSIIDSQFIELLDDDPEILSIEE